MIGIRIIYHFKTQFLGLDSGHSPIKWGSKNNFSDYGKGFYYLLVNLFLHSIFKFIGATKDSY